MRTIEDLKKEGYEGPDADLDTSLVSYGLAWHYENKEWLFLYSVNGSEIEFDWGCIGADTDIFQEYDWVKWDEFLSQYGEENPREWFSSLSLPLQINELVGYYGVVEIFGDSYHGGEIIRTEVYEDSMRELIEESSQELVDAFAAYNLKPEQLKLVMGRMKELGVSLKYLFPVLDQVKEMNSTSVTDLFYHTNTSDLDEVIQSILPTKS